MPMSLRVTLLSLSFTLFSGFVIANTSPTAEEQRIELAQSAIPHVVEQFDKFVMKFSNELKTLDNKTELNSYVTSTGALLWKKATKSIVDKNNFEDRSLYWARLKMTQHLRTSTIFSTLSTHEQQQLLWNFELASRGEKDVIFDKNTDKKILLLGFDPFLLDRNIEQSNPSGITAISFDNKVIDFEGTTAEIETLIIPVRFYDFDNGIIEQLLTPYMKEKSVDMVVTVSMGRKDFDLERFPNLRRSSATPGNLNVKTGANPQNPLAPYLHGKALSGPEFIEFSLPVKAMQKAAGKYAINDNRVISIAPKGLTKEGMPSLDLISVSGSGGGYLSNEISYRSLLLRNKYNPELPVGHIHTPRIKEFDVEVIENITTQIENMLKHAIKVI